MNEDVSTEKLDDGLLQYSPADIAGPDVHAHHHTQCWRDRSRVDEDIERLEETIVLLTKRIEDLERR